MYVFILNIYISLHVFIYTIYVDIYLYMLYFVLFYIFYMLCFIWCICLYILLIYSIVIYIYIYIATLCICVLFFFNLSDLNVFCLQTSSLVASNAHYFQNVYFWSYFLPFSFHKHPGFYSSVLIPHLGPRKILLIWLVSNETIIKSFSLMLSVH